MTHRGVEMLYCDFTNFQRDVAGLQAEVDAADAEILKRPRGSVLAIADVSGTVTSSEVVSLFKKSAAATASHVVKQAVVGVTGIQKVLAQGVAFFSGQSMHLFTSLDDAKQWLAGASSNAGEKIGADLSQR
jgi:hypothetical protein